MLLAKIVCSDPGCEQEIEISVRRLIQLDGLVCDCGFGFVLQSVSEVAERGGEVVSIARRRPQGRRRPAKHRSRAA